MTSESLVADSALNERTKSASFYRPELDVLRFFAFFAVFFTHLPRPHIQAGDSVGSAIFKSACALLQDCGVFGMGIFFLLSAYLITELLQREKLQTDTIHLRAFYTRRILRIWPLYFTALFLGYLVSRSGPGEWIGIGRMASFLLLAGNWYTARHGYATNPIAPLWSISLEEQFYVVWPTLAKLAGRKALIVFCYAVLGAGFGVIAYLRELGVNMQPGIWTNSFVQFPLFAIGALLAIYLKGRKPVLPAWSRLLLFMGGLSLWLVAEGRLAIIWGKPGPFATCVGFGLASLGSLAIFLSLFGMPAQFTPKPLVYLGRISYGLYVFAPFAGFLLDLAPRSFSFSLGTYTCANLALAIALATVSYYILERPFLRLKSRFEFVYSRRA